MVSSLLDKIEAESDKHADGDADSGDVAGESDTEETHRVTDDNGNVYLVDGKLLPNTTYELNGNIYQTDDKGRILKDFSNPSSTLLS